MPAWQTAARAALAIGIVGALLLLFFPNGWAINRLVVRIYVGLGLPRYSRIIPLDDPTRFDFGDLCNVILFVPLCAALVLASTRLAWWAAGLIGSAASACVELIQFVALDGRDASIVDVATNTIGAFIGACLGFWIRKKVTTP